MLLHVLPHLDCGFLLVRFDISGVTLHSLRPLLLLLIKPFQDLTNVLISLLLDMSTVLHQLLGSVFVINISHNLVHLYDFLSSFPLVDLLIKTGHLSETSTFEACCVLAKSLAT